MRPRIPRPSTIFGLSLVLALLLVVAIVNTAARAAL